jgi:hypothetical protein
MARHGFSLSSDAIRMRKTYAGLVLEETKTLPSSLGLKSVLFNPAGTKLYALNLEGGSIYEFSQSEKKISREIVFQRTKSRGLGYTTGRTIGILRSKKSIKMALPVLGSPKDISRIKT